MSGDLRDIMSQAVMKVYKEELEKRERFIKRMVGYHCKWWQKEYVFWALKHKLKISFLEIIVIQKPHELNSELMNFDFGTQEKFGVKINGTIHWLEY